MDEELVVVVVDAMDDDVGSPPQTGSLQIFD
jgi:hypothetical protein